MIQNYRKPQFSILFQLNRYEKQTTIVWYGIRINYAFELRQKKINLLTFVLIIIHQKENEIIKIPQQDKNYQSFIYKKLEQQIIIISIWLALNSITS
ncbi:hypothetical protein pb186bvf_007882 [Paramecium bursaria]